MVCDWLAGVCGWRGVRGWLGVFGWLGCAVGRTRESDGEQKPGRRSGRPMEKVVTREEHTLRTCGRESHPPTSREQAARRPLPAHRSRGRDRNARASSNPGDVMSVLARATADMECSAVKCDEHCQRWCRDCALGVRKEKAPPWPRTPYVMSADGGVRPISCWHWLSKAASMPQQHMNERAD
jgi:hypothetical protein